MAQDTGLVKRGLLLLALISALVVVLLIIIFERTTTHLPASVDRPELLGALVALPDAPFPASVSWSGVYRINEAFPSAPGASPSQSRMASPGCAAAIAREVRVIRRRVSFIGGKLGVKMICADKAAARSEKNPPHSAMVLFFRRQPS